MNTTIETILNHRSIRKYTNEPVSDEQIETIIQAAQSASTSSFVQAYSIIGIKDDDGKKKIAELSKNTHVEHASRVLIFCADFYRHELMAENKGESIADTLESTEKFIVGITDTTLAAQNAAIAAESMGLGICYLGGIRNNIESIAEYLELPSHVSPLFGMTIGYPADQSNPKPRLPLHHVYHEGKYNQDVEVYTNQLKEYDETVSSYYDTRTSGQRQDRWSDQMTNMLSKQVRMNMKDFVQGKGFNKA